MHLARRTRVRISILAFALTAPISLTATLDAQARPEAPSRDSGLHRAGVDQSRGNHRFNLELGVGLAGAEGLGAPHPLLAVTPRIRLAVCSRSTVSLTLPFLVVPDAQTSARDARLEGGTVLDPRGLEVGPSLVFTPSLEWSFRRGCCLRPFFFAGIGVRHDRGRAATVGIGPELVETVDLTIDDATSPVFTAGFGLERPLARNLAVRFEARGVVTFYRGTRIRDLDGFPFADLDRGRVTSIFTTLGFRLVF